MGWLGSFFSNLGDALATGGNREAFRAKRGARLQATGRDANWNQYMAILGRLAREAYELELAKKAEGPRQVQYEDDEMHVEVKSGFSRDNQSWTTDIIVAPRKGNLRGSHLHVIYDEHGREIYNQWRDNK